MSESNALTRPLGPNVPLPGGDQVDTPQQRLTLPGGSPGGGGNAPATGPAPAGGVGDLPSPNMSFDGSRKTLMQEHLRSKAQYQAMSKALKQLDHVRKGLQTLADKQDMVSMDDLIDEAGKLVAHGIDPMALAGVLADAPQEGGGEALGAWVASHAQTAADAEQNLMQQRALAQHQMGVSAIHLLMAHANAQHMLGGISPPIGRGLQEDNNDLDQGTGEEIPQSTPGDHEGNSLTRTM